MIGLEHDSRLELRRWLLSGAVVLMAHGGLAAAALHWTDAEDADEPSSAMVVNLAPMPVAPDSLSLPLPPGPEQMESEASFAKPVETVEEKVEEEVETSEAQEVMPELERAIDPEIVLAALPPEKKEVAPKPREISVASIASAPEAAEVPHASVAAAPSPGKLNITNSNAIPTWKRRVVNLIERNKRYPDVARSRGHRGTTLLAFTLDREGHVRTSRIMKSSGSAALDREALEVLRRAEPFPAFPPEMQVGTIDLTLPMQFTLR